MSKEQDEIKHVNGRKLELEQVEEHSRKDTEAAKKDDELDEGLEESMDGSDAPSSTRLSSKD